MKAETGIIIIMALLLFVTLGSDIAVLCGDRWIVYGPCSSDIAYDCNTLVESRISGEDLQKDLAETSYYQIINQTSVKLYGRARLFLGMWTTCCEHICNGEKSLPKEYVIPPIWHLALIAVIVTITQLKSTKDTSYVDEFDCRPYYVTFGWTFYVLLGATVSQIAAAGFGLELVNEIFNKGDTHKQPAVQTPEQMSLVPGGSGVDQK